MRIYLIIFSISFSPGLYAIADKVEPETENPYLKRLFEQYDKDSSGWWNEEEYAEMINDLEKKQPLLKNGLPSFQQVDTNSDNRIDFHEANEQFMKLSDSTQKSLFPERERDSKNEKKLSPEEASAKVEGKGLPDDMKFDEDGKMFKHLDEGEVKLKSNSNSKKKPMSTSSSIQSRRDLEVDEISNKNPKVAKFVKLGRFVQDRLNEIGVGQGVLTGLRSSPRNLEGIDISDKDQAINLDVTENGVTLQGLLLEIESPLSKHEDGFDEKKKEDDDLVVMDEEEAQKKGEYDSAKGMSSEKNILLIEAFVALHNDYNKETHKNMTKAALVSAWKLTKYNETYLSQQHAKKEEQASKDYIKNQMNDLTGKTMQTNQNHKNNDNDYYRDNKIFPLAKKTLSFSSFSSFSLSFKDVMNEWIQDHYRGLRTTFGVIIFSVIVRLIRVGLTKLFSYFFKTSKKKEGDDTILSEKEKDDYNSLKDKKSGTDSKVAMEKSTYSKRSLRKRKTK